MFNAQITSNVAEIEEYTGLNHKELWAHGFDLDDWNICVISNTRLITYAGIDEDGEPYYEPIDDAYWLIRQMEGYCCGYKEVEYNGEWYYMVYH